MSINHRLQRHLTYKDNLLTAFETTGGPTFSFNAAGSGDIDGLGRLQAATEKLTDTTPSTVTYNVTYDYDMRSQLIDATNDNIDSSTWDVDYAYYNNGDINTKTEDSTATTYTYNSGNQMTGASGGDSFSLDWDENGNMKVGVVSESTLVYNWDGKLRNANYDAKLIKLRYDPMGNRIWKYSSEAGTRKHIVDIAGDLPVILLELDTENSNSIEKTYLYANGQVL